MRIYLASPFFDEKELDIYHQVMEILRNKHLDVYAPLLNQIDRQGLSKEQWAEQTFKKDTDEIKQADVIIMLFYGLYSDSGTAWECGYSYALGKKVIAVHLHDGKSNCMINCSCHANLKGLEELKFYDFSSMPKINYYTNKIVG